MTHKTIKYIKEIYGTNNFIPLHAPVFLGNEKKYLNECIDSTFVSYVGKYVAKFEEMTANYTGVKYAVAMVNGTAALQIALKIVGVSANDEVITQSLTFVATCNAIKHNGAIPTFVDVDKETLGMSPEKLNSFLKNQIKFVDGICVNKATSRRITAIAPVHIFGHPNRIDEIVEIAQKYNLKVVEDSAESLGSFYKGKHTGTFGDVGILSYNGNKALTTGGGGMLITNSKEFAEHAKHITTTAKAPHKYEYIHDEIGFNYRLTNVNAAIGVAQMENIEQILENKRATAKLYKEFFTNSEIEFIDEPKHSKSNFWLNAIILKDRKERDLFLDATNKANVMTRPIWKLMNKLDIFSDSYSDDLSNSEWLEDRVVNIPSSYRI
ncbi:MAG: LegC family aminotransferase [Melioribacteraceae bacterium]|nr:LegC family aminotransferase [Melioribacteraceae bacterium]